LSDGVINQAVDVKKFPTAHYFKYLYLDVPRNNFFAAFQSH
jgi:hypothetical protein